MLGLSALALAIWYDFRMAGNAMSKVKIRTIHGKQGTLQTTIVDADQMVIAQPDPTGAAGFRTVTITALQSYNAIKEVLKNTPNLISIGEGLLGTGISSDPVRVDIDFLNRQWVNKRFANLAQVGLNPGTGILFSRSGTQLTWGGHPCFLAGISQTIPSQIIDIQSVLPNPAGKTVYIYLIASNGQLKFDYTFDPRSERYDSAYLAQFKFGTGSQASTIIYSDDRQFIRFDNYRISSDSASDNKIRGASYPVSAGIVYEVGYTVVGSAEGNSFKMTNSILGYSDVQDLWPGKNTDRVMIMGASALISHAFGNSIKDTLTIPASLIVKSENAVARPPFLLLTAIDPEFNVKCKLKRVSNVGNRGVYQGVTYADDVYLTTCISRGATSQLLEVTVVGSNT